MITRTNKFGFTVIELLIVLVIIGIFALLFIVDMNKPPKEKGAPTPPVVVTESDDLSLGHGNYGQILVLPTGERILMINPGGKVHDAVLLPPLTPAAKVER